MFPVFDERGRFIEWTPLTVGRLPPPDCAEDSGSIGLIEPAPYVPRLIRRNVCDKIEPCLLPNLQLPARPKILKRDALCWLFRLS